MRLILLSVPLLLAIGAVQAPPAAHAEVVTGTVTVGNNPWGVAYDSGAGEVFVANSGSGRTVSVISDSTNTVAATITLPSGDTSLTGVAYDSGAGEVFVASEGGGVVAVYCDGTNSGSCPTPNTLVTTIGPAVSGLSCSSTCSGLYVANGVAYDSAKGEVFVSTGDCVSSQCYVYVISDSSNTVTAAVPIGSSPGYAAGLAYDSGANEIFVPINSPGQVKVISDSTNTVAATISLPSGSHPIAIAYDSGKGEVFVANEGGTVSVICDGTVVTSLCTGSGTTDTVVATVTLNQQYTSSSLGPGIAYDAGTGEVFVGVYPYYASAISDASNTVVGTVYVGGPATYGIAYDSGKGETFVAANGTPGSVAVISNPSITPSPSRVSSGGSITVSGSNFLASTPLDNPSCAASSGYIYCVGGYTGGTYSNAVYYAPLSSSGAGPWASTTPYPSGAFGVSCQIYSGYIYCVGGYTGSTYLSSVYYAPVSSSGVGTWTSTTAYPIDFDLGSCGISSGYMFCVGGYTGSAYSTAVYYAAVSSSGAGTWTSTTAYPSNVYGQSCNVSGGYIYCVGGYTGSTYLNSVYYAAVSSSGAGTWTSTTAYPTGIYVNSCAIYSGYIYCVDGYTGSAYTNAVYYAAVTSGGVGTWTSTTAYPTTVDRESCVTSSGYVYCLGGNYSGQLSSAVYFASASSAGTGSWAATSSYGPRTYNYCFESGVTSSPSACSSTYQFQPTSSGAVPSSTTLAATGTTGLVVVSDSATGTILSSSLVTLFADPTVSVTPAGPLSYSVGQSASALTASVTYTGPDTTSVSWYSSTTSSCGSSSTSTGTSGSSFTPSTASAGTTYYCAVVSDSGVAGYGSPSNAVKVTVGASSSARITLSETSGSVGDVISVSGTGFSPSSTITSVKFDGVSETTSPSSISTTPTGSFTASLTIPASTAGSHTLTASDGINSGSASFTVLPAVTLTPGTRGPQGTVVTVIGTGFAASESVSAAFGGVPISLSGTASTNSVGSVSVSFTVAGVSSGPTTFTLTDASGNSASSTITVMAGTTATGTSVACAPSAVVGGASTVCTATVSGSSPTGTVTFASASGVFSPAATCAVITSGTQEGSCYVEFVSPTAAGAQTITASYSGDQVNTPSTGTYGLTVVALSSLSLSVSCSPTVSVGASDACTATVTPSTATGDVSFSVSNTNVMLSLPECSLSSGSCSVNAIGATVGIASLTATFVGQSSMASLVVAPAASNSVAQAASFGIISAAAGSGGSSVLTSFNGICDSVSLANTGAPAGTQVGALCQSLSGPSTGTPGAATGAYLVTYYDLQVAGATTGAATVCLPDTGATTGSTMEYYALPAGSWTPATDIEVPPASPSNTICGEIPVNELDGTNILLGNHILYQISGLLPTTTLVACPSSAVTIGSILTCTISVTSDSGAPSGSISLSSNPQSSDLGLQSTCSLAATSSTAASCSIAVQPSPGAAYSPYVVTASYSGDLSHSTSLESIMLSVQDVTSTTIVCSPAQVTVGSSTTCTVTVEDTTSPSSTPTAFVLLSGSSSMGAQVNSGCQLNSSGVCVISLMPESQGSFTVSGEYIGDATHASSQGSAIIVSTAGTTTTTTTTTVSSTATFTSTTVTASSSSTSTTLSTTTTTTTTTTSTTTTQTTATTPAQKTSTTSKSSTSSTTTVPAPPVTTTLTSTSVSTSTPTTTVAGFPYLVLGIVVAVVVASVGVALWRRRVAGEYAKHPPVEL